MTKPAHIFLSFAHADHAFAKRVAKELAKVGARSFGMDHTPGIELFSRIKKELKLSDLVVFVVPSQEGEGRGALAEIGAAMALDKNILGVLPDRSRYANSSFLSSVTDRPVVDATNLSPSSLAHAIVASASAH